MTKFKTLIADPPWRFSNSGTNGAAQKHYPTMSVKELKALAVRDIADRDAVIFMWACWSILDDAQEVLKAWGFRYKTGLPWLKLVDSELDRGNLRPKYGTGFWGRACSEPILVGTRGKVEAPRTSNLALLSPSLEHSRKPDSLHELAEALPGPRLELFARRERPGWTCWGNELGTEIPELSTWNDASRLRSCVVCGCELTSRRTDSITCSARCRQNKKRCHTSGAVGGSSVTLEERVSA